MFRGLLATMRPRQWVKNLPVLAPLAFAQRLDDPHAAARALFGAAMFCLFSGAVYVLNDLVDVDADRRHPTKRNRAIASGALKESQAKVALAVIMSVAVAGGALLGAPFLLAGIGYLVLNIAYSFKLKNIAYLDVLCIAAGFELRVLAGAFAADVPPSAYLLVVVFLGACFMGLGKRAHELGAVLQPDGRSGTASTRKALSAYSPTIVTRLLYFFGLATTVTYLVYTLDPRTVEMFETRWLVATTLFTAAGIGRFIYLVQRTQSAESPTDAMLGDPPFLVNLGLWGACTLLLIYLT